jgi:hypothetical protein
MTEKEKLISELSASGKLTEIYKAGFVSYKVLMYRDIFYDLKTQIEIYKQEKSVAVQDVADKYNVHIATVYRAIKFFI